VSVPADTAGAEGEIAAAFAAHESESLKARRDYHGREYQIAREGRVPGSRPRVPANARVVLDVGCGAGQTLAALEAPEGALLVGVDVELETFAALELPDARIHRVGGEGEALPVASASCDFVICRVALPYMNVPTALGEMARVLRAGGSLWLTLHPAEMILASLRGDLRRGHWRSAAFQCFVLLNGLILAATGRQLRFPLNRSRQETFQTAAGMRRDLRRAGFEDIHFERYGAVFIASARRSPILAAPRAD
jgi:ubiquinone/menaquinone biosynthesis C-methylase UbiE